MDRAVHKSINCKLYVVCKVPVAVTSFSKWQYGYWLVYITMCTIIFELEYG